MAGQKGTNFFTKVSSTIDGALTDKSGNLVLISCAAGSLPTGEGYAVGCIALATDTGVCYSNTGTVSAATFTAFNSASALTLPSAFTDATTTTGAGLDINDTAITTGSAFKVANGNTTNFTTGGKLVELDMGAAVAGNGLTITTSAAYTGTGLAVLTAGAMTTGVLLQLTSTTGLTSGSLLRATTSTAGALATNGAYSFRGTGAFTSTTVGLVDILATAAIAGIVLSVRNSAAQTTGTIFQVKQTGTTTGYTGNVAEITGSSTTGQANTLAVIGVHTTVGNVVSITNASASQTGASLLSVVQSGTTTGFTGAVATITSSSTTGTGAGVLLTMVNTVAGDGIKIVSNALTLGAGTALNIAHTTSVLGAGTSLARISSTGVDTGTTTGVLLDLSTSACAGSTQVLLTDSSADTSARIGIYSKITNAAAVLAIPFKSSNVAVVNSKFTKHMVFTDGTKTFTMWLSQDATDPNGTLTGVVGDVCFNGPSNKPYYCTAAPTTWATIV